jgi:polyisoprenoid-binding protein YceI
VKDRQKEEKGMKKILGLLLACVVANTCMATDYKIDPSHSSIGFKVRHLAISWVPGAFSDFSGTFSYDPANVSGAKLRRRSQ